MPEKDITYEIIEYLGVISTHSNGWSKELNLISWNGGPPKYDIREWDEHHERMRRGVTLHEGELRKLINLFFRKGNNQKIEKGRAEEAERKARQETARREYSAGKDLSLEEAEAEAFEGAKPPEESHEAESTLTYGEIPQCIDPPDEEEKPEQMEIDSVSESERAEEHSF